MRKQSLFLLAISALVLCIPVSKAGADVVIKVRALNPLEAEETASIRYPLPKEIQPEDIIAKDIKYSKPDEIEEVEEGEEAEEKEPRTTTFNVEYVEEEGGYYIIDEIPLKPREVVTLEARVKDIWMISQDKLDGIKQEVERLIVQAGQETQTDPGGLEEVEEEAEIDATAMALKDEISKELDEIALQQGKNTVLNVGVEAHMEAYYENMEALRQVEADVVMMRYLMEPEPEEGEGEGEEAQEETQEETQETEEPHTNPGGSFEG